MWGFFPTHISSTTLSRICILVNIIKVYLTYDDRDSKEQSLTGGCSRPWQRSTHSGGSFNMECLDSWLVQSSFTAVKWPRPRQAVGRHGFEKFKFKFVFPPITSPALFTPISRQNHCVLLTTILDYTLSPQPKYKSVFMYEVWNFSNF